MKKRVAFCLHGAISKIGKRFDTQWAIYNNNEYVNYNACYNSIIKHIIDSNKNYEFDFFIHCWNYDLKDNLINLYNPKSSLFEDNRLYQDEINKRITNPNDFGGISRSLSIKKSIELLEQYNTNIYNKVIIYRPDVILFKDIILDIYDNNIIYTNDNFGGDFHFIMNYENALLFKELYNSSINGNPHKYHFWIKNFIINFIKKKLLADNVAPGRDQEVLRKIYSTTVATHKIDINKLLEYGLTKEEIAKYSDI